MRASSRIKTWWRALTGRAEMDRQIDEELQFHIESYADDLVRQGMTQIDALRRAHAELGSVVACRENCRQAWGTRWLDELRGDVRFAIRMLLKSPGFAAIAIGSLALGIGANTVIFTTAQHMLLDRLSVPHPEQLRLFEWAQGRDGIVSQMWGWWDTSKTGEELATSFSYPVYQQLRKENRELADVFAFKPYGRLTATIDGQAQAVDTEMVSGNYFSALEIQPQLGRAIQDSDDAAVSSAPVIVISDRLWTNRFGRSPQVLGKTILVNSTPMIVVGVNPPGFTGAHSAQASPDIFLPFSMQPVVDPRRSDPDRPKSMLEDKQMWWVLVMGRVRPGVADATAAASLNVRLSGAVRATMPVSKDNQIPRLILRDGSRGENPNADDLATPVAVLMGLSGLVLLLACANLANLLLARAGARRREMSVRLALGARRGRILRQMMTESLLLSSLGGLTGLLLAWLVRNAIPQLLSNRWSPPAFSARFNWQILFFAIAISLITGLIFGFAPAWHATRAQVSSGLKDAGQTVTRRRRALTGKAIVTFQVALSMLLVVCAGLFVQTLLRLEHSPVGFRTHNLLLFSLQLPETRYPGAASTPVMQRLEEKLKAIPGVEAASLIRVPLISGSAMNSRFIPEGSPFHSQDQKVPVALTNDVGVDFFKTFQIPILAGRGFTEDDSATSRKVAVVNESLAKKYFPNVSPIGRTFDVGGKQAVAIEIIGICGDAKYYRRRQKMEPTFYVPYAQKAGGTSDATFAIASRRDGEMLLPSIREAVRSVDRNLPLLDLRTQDEQIDANLQHERIFASLTAGFGVLALVLACVGIYGIMAYSVSQRTSEIGIRMALGARRVRMLWTIVLEASWLALAGVVVGIVAALVLGRLIANLLYGVKANDVATFLGSAFVLLLVALGATWIPARRAASVNPMQALRHE